MFFKKHKHAVVCCMDFRLHRSIDKWMKRKKLFGDFDMISVAGAGKDIVDNPDGFVVTQIILSKKLHNTQSLLLMHHTDCGAYGGHKAFKNLEEEKIHHLSEMKKAVKIIHSKKLGIEIKMLLANIDEKGKVKIEEIK